MEVVAVAMLVIGILGFGPSSVNGDTDPTDGQHFLPISVCNPAALLDVFVFLFCVSPQSTFVGKNWSIAIE